MEDTLKKLRPYDGWENMSWNPPHWIIVTFTNGDGNTIYIYNIDHSHVEARERLYECFYDAVICGWAFAVRPSPIGLT